MSHVKQHTRTSKTGKVSVVHGYDDKRKKTTKGKPKGKSKVTRTPVKHVIKKADPGMVKMRDQITEWLRTEKGREELTEKVKAGGFSKTLPEVLNLYGLEQGAHHPLPDAFDHTMELFKHLPDNASDNVLWATLLHDIGKGETQKFHKTRGIIFDGHEYKGYKMTQKTLRRLDFNKKNSEEILHMILHHGNLRTQILRSETAKAHKFVNHQHFDSLLTLHKADVIASGRDPHEVVDRHKLLKQTEGFRQHLYDQVAKDLGSSKSKSVELNDDGSVSLYLGQVDKLADDKGNVDLKVEKAAQKALKSSGPKGWKVYTDFEPGDDWVAVHFEPKD